jgi:prevent-host-death family protein
MKTINIHAARTHLFSLVEEVAKGEEIIITKAGKPVARLIAMERATFDRKPGTLKHLIEIYRNFDDALPLEIAEAFGIPGASAPRPDS